jgi:hypothetical protein
MLRDVLHNDPGRFLVLLLVGLGVWAVAIVGAVWFVWAVLNAEPVPGGLTD